MLEVKEINTYYGSVHALKSVSIKVDCGQIVTLIGSNGAGKSTLLKTISGLINPSGGTIMLGGRPITNMPPNKIVRLGVIQVPEGRKIFGNLSVYDNLRLGAYSLIKGQLKKEVNEGFLAVYKLFPMLEKVANKKAGLLSGGMQQMLSIGRSIMASPKLLLLDEPSLGLAPLVIVEIFNAINRINREKGTTVFLVEQNARMALKLASYGYVIETGSIVLAGLSSRLLVDEMVKTHYLGF